MHEWVSFSPSLRAFVLITNFYLSNSDMRSWVISHCGFNFHSPNDWWCQTSFHVLIRHLYILFGEVLQVFYPFFQLDCWLPTVEMSQFFIKFLDTSPLFYNVQRFSPTLSRLFILTLSFAEWKISFVKPLFWLRWVFTAMHRLSAVVHGPHCCGLWALAVRAQWCGVRA